MEAVESRARTMQLTTTPEPEYGLMLDVVAPLTRPRVDHATWDSSRWGTALNVADWHRLSPALYAHLQSAGGGPPAVQSALERAYLANFARSMSIRDATNRVLAALGTADVPALLLKGAALVATVYPDPARREMLDVDLLVPGERMRAAADALRALGYTPVPDTTPAGGGTGVRVTPHHDAALVAPDQLVAVELHRHITIAGEGRRFGLEELWERSRTVPATYHRVPAPEDLLIHVCVHFTRNRLGGRAQRRNTGGALAQIMDIDLIVGGEDLDWDLLARKASNAGLGTRVFLGLFAARELGVPIAHEVLEGLWPTGFDQSVGRRLVALRVLRAGDHLPVRSMRWMFAPSKEALRRGWNADPNATLSLARAYMRRARAHVPEARGTLRRPWTYVQDQRLNGQINALEEHA
jgi:hypothetical protein